MKTKIFLSLLAVSAIFFTSCKKEKHNTPVNNDPELLNPETGKVIHYSFNGSLNDGSGNGLNPLDSIDFSYTADRFGRANQALLFGDIGTTRIITPSPAAKITGLPISVSFWFRTNDFSETQCLIKSDGLERSTYSGYTVYLSAWGEKKLSFSIGNNTGTGGSSYFVIISPEVITTNNTWYHVVVNVRSASDYDFYINNVKYTNCSTNGSASTMVFNTPSAGILGLYDGIANTEFKGAFDDYRLYNHSLSQQEVSTLYNYHP